MRRVLVVDGNRALAEAVVCALRLDGHEARAAADPCAAAALLVWWDPDVVVLEPRGAGGAGALARAAARAGVAVVLCSAADPRTLPAEAVRLGAAAVLRKPFPLDALLAAVGAQPGPGRERPPVRPCRRGQGPRPRARPEAPGSRRAAGGPRSG